MPGNKEDGKGCVIERNESLCEGDIRDELNEGHVVAFNAT
jgi:hypothetical protein